MHAISGPEILSICIVQREQFHVWQAYMSLAFSNKPGDLRRDDDLLRGALCASFATPPWVRANCSKVARWLSTPVFQLFFAMTKKH